ncbi:MAG: hypothetical protein ACFNZS_01090 [Ottowia sp.]|jgi:hypothetical protein
MAVKIPGLKPVIVTPATLYILSDGGQYETFRFNVHFKRLTRDKLDGLAKTFMEGEIKLPDVLDQIVTGWDGLKDENGMEVPYSPKERRAADDDFPGLEQAMMVSWFDHMFVTQRQAAEKNSAAPSATGSAQTAQTATSSTTV